MPISRAVRASMFAGASISAVPLERNRRWADPKMLCAMLVWCCLVIVLGFLLKEPSGSMTATITHPHPTECAIYHIAENVGFAPNNGLFSGDAGESA